MNSPIRHKFHRWRPSACLQVSGEDSLRFLQGQFTNDLQKRDTAGAVYGLWLNQKGKVLADSFVQQNAGLPSWVVSYFSPAAVIRERLEAYIIADDVVIEGVTEEVGAITVFADEGERVKVPGGGIVFAGRRGGEAHREIVYPLSAESEIAALVDGWESLSSAEMERRRILAGIPAVPADIGPTDLPNEGGLDADAISYTKGCYLGQEVMARLKSMGQVRRRLMRVRGSGVPVLAGAHLFQAGKKVGELRSVAVDGEGWIGLALILLLQLQRGEGLALRPDGAAEVSVDAAS